MSQSRKERSHQNLKTCLRRLPPGNLGHFQRHLDEHRRKGNKMSTMANVAHTAVLLSDFLGRDYATASKHDLTAWILWLQERYSPESVYHHATVALHPPGRHASPQAARGASPRAPGAPSKQGRLRGLHHRHRVPRDPGRHPARQAAQADALMWTAVVWLLYDCGARISEALSLRLCDVQLELQHRAFKVRLPNIGSQEEDLKDRHAHIQQCRGFRGR